MLRRFIGPAAAVDLAASARIITMERIEGPSKIQQPTGKIIQDEKTGDLSAEVAEVDNPDRDWVDLVYEIQTGGGGLG